MPLLTSKIGKAAEARNLFKNSPEGQKLPFQLEVMMFDLSGVPDKASCSEDFNSSLFLVSPAASPHGLLWEFLSPTQSISFSVLPASTRLAHPSLPHSCVCVSLFLFPPTPLCVSLSHPQFSILVTLSFSFCESAFIKYMYTYHLPLDCGQKIYSYPGEVYNSTYLFSIDPVITQRCFLKVSCVYHLPIIYS